jgi:nitrogen fixation NifU-like protein
MFSEKIMNRFLSPKNVGLIKKADGVGTCKSELGDEIKVYLRITKNVIDDAKFKVFGGVASIVLADGAMELVKGKKIDDVLLTSFAEVLATEQDFSIEQKPNAEMVANAIILAIKDYRKKTLKQTLKSASIK